MQKNEIHFILTEFVINKNGYIGNSTNAKLNMPNNITTSKLFGIEYERMIR